MISARFTSSGFRRRLYPPYFPSWLPRIPIFLRSRRIFSRKLWGIFSLVDISLICIGPLPYSLASLERATIAYLVFFESIILNHDWKTVQSVYPEWGVLFFTITQFCKFTFSVSKYRCNLVRVAEGILIIAGCSLMIWAMIVLRINVRGIPLNACLQPVFVTRGPYRFSGPPLTRTFAF